MVYNEEEGESLFNSRPGGLKGFSKHDNEDVFGFMFRPNSSYTESGVHRDRFYGGGHFVLPKDNDKESHLPEVNPISSTEPYEFEVSASDIVKAIIQNKKIGKIDVVEKVQDPTFRFTSKVASSCSELDASDLSEAFAILLARARSDAAKKSAAKSIVKRSEKANVYASEMYDTIKKMQVEAGVKTVRATIKLLNDKKVETPNKAEKWYPNTLQSLQKRWKELGLIPSAPNPK